MTPKRMPYRSGSTNPPLQNIARKAQDPDIFEVKNFLWRADDNYIDYDDEEWGWCEVPMQKFFNKCLRYLQHYEGKTWAQIKQEGHCHPVSLEDIVPKAQRIILNRFGDMNDLWQVKAEGRCRLFGWKDKQLFYLIWHDEKHTVYPRGK